jgi:hypothetical protein
MSKKQYLRLAAELKFTKSNATTAERMEQWRSDTRAMCRVLDTFSTTFKPHEFLAACGYEAD